VNRREFVKLTSAGVATLALPITLSTKHGKYSGQCEWKSEYCFGKDSHPFTPKTSDVPRGPILCEYHGTYVKKLKLLSLPELEYIANHPNNAMMVREIMKVAVPSTGEKVKHDKRMHHIRQAALEVSDEYWKKNHRIIMGCPNQLDRRRMRELRV